MTTVSLRPETTAMRALSVVITGLMVALGIVVLAGAASLRHLDIEWRQALTGRWTVELDGAAPAGSADLERALAALRALPGVKDATPVPPDEIHRLLRPWLKDDALAAELPVPALIDLKIDPAAHIPASELAPKVAAAVPGARLDDHGEWTSDLLGIARTGEALGLLLFAAIALTAIATIAATARTQLSANVREIELLHTLGATDGYIARQFRSGPLKTAVAGALAGTAFAAAGLIVLGRTAAPAMPLLPQLRLAGADWALLAVVPLGAILLAGLVSSLTAWLLARRLP